ncbi:hypothetical protein D3C83_318120 [compost metagenome]
MPSGRKAAISGDLKDVRNPPSFMMGRAVLPPSKTSAMNFSALYSSIQRRAMDEPSLRKKFILM